MRLYPVLFHLVSCDWSPFNGWLRSHPPSQKNLVILDLVAMCLFFHLSACFQLSICTCLLVKIIILFLNVLLLRWQVSSTHKHSPPVDFDSMPSKALDQVCPAILMKQLFLSFDLAVNPQSIVPRGCNSQVLVCKLLLCQQGSRHYQKWALILVAGDWAEADLGHFGRGERWREQRRGSHWW